MCDIPQGNTSITRVRKCNNNNNPYTIAGGCVSYREGMTHYRTAIVIVLLSAHFFSEIFSLYLNLRTSMMCQYEYKGNWN